jgi:pimeloyl-ACP methyl ester carboxylesterase
MATSDALGEVHEIRLENGPIRYREAGRGRPIVFVHGYLVNGDLWRKVVPKLSGEFRCITADWPMGSHELPMDDGADLSPPAVADLIAEFIERLGLDDVVLVANDSGGAISQLVVTRKPERIGAMVLTPCDAFEDFPPSAFKALGVIARTPVLRDIVYQSMRIPLARRAGFRPLMKHGYDAAIVKSWVTPGLRDAKVRRDGNKFAAGMDPKYTLAVAKLLPEFEKPVLLTWPPKNTFFKFKTAKRLAALFPNARIVEIPDALTFVSEDQPDQLAAAVAEFAAA